MEVSLKILFESLLNEGRTKSVIDKWSNHVVSGFEGRGPLKNEDDWDYVIREFTSPEVPGNGKYLDYMLSQLVMDWEYWLRGASDEIPSITTNVSNLVNLIKSFHNLSERNLIQNKDIYSKDYKDITNLEYVVRHAKQKSEELAKERKLQSEADKIYQDGRWIVIVPKTHEASCHYGAGTKWCTTMKNSPSYYSNYTTNGCLFYILDKSRTEGRLYKLAIHWTYAPMSNIVTEKDEESGFEYKYQPLVLTNMAAMKGFDEEDKNINLEHIIPLLPKGLIDSIKEYYQKNLQRINSIKKNEARQKQVNDVLAQLQRQELNRVRKEELFYTFIRYITNPHPENPDNIYPILEEVLSNITNANLNRTYGYWEYGLFIDNGRRFIINPVGDYPNVPVEAQQLYFIEGMFFPNIEGMSVNNFSQLPIVSLQVYKTKEGAPYGDPDHADAISQTFTIPISDVIYRMPFLTDFTTTCHRFAHVNNFADVEDWAGNYIVRMVIDESDIIEKFLTQLDTIISNHLLKLLFNNNVPSKDGSVLWKPSSSHSSYKFEYPADPYSMTSRFLNYIRENPGRTSEQFYLDVYGRGRPAGHNSTFFSSIKDAGLVRMVRNGRQFGYYIGPNYEAWTQGRLKRI